ncbi:MAG: DUF4340 domain-containing protein [Woeseiaceae bacterium]|nr:DUF4340 domain-containing protein [Woeseiaceae bacterium]
MTASNLKILAAISVALILVLFALQLGEDDTSVSGQPLLPGLKSKINDIESVTVTRAGDDAQTVIEKSESGWVVSSRNGYPADVGKLRELLLALADAKAIERKTSNAELYENLGLRDPEIEGSRATRLELGWPEDTVSVVIGNVAQGGYRYARVGSEPQSWLIDKNPAIPGTTGEWLLREILDIKAADIRSATISHPDGEEIRINKISDEGSDFEVTNIPEGRELSYATVANSITGVLSSLSLEDVREAGEVSGDAVTTIFETVEGARIEILTEKSDDESWITVSATSEAGLDAITALNERTSGWQFRIPQYKANQLTRRWDDILKAASDGE